MGTSKQTSKHANKNGYKQANIHSETHLQRNSDTLHAVCFNNFRKDGSYIVKHSTQLLCNVLYEANKVLVLNQICYSIGSYYSLIVNEK